jgi:cell wall-associated NlpC family hydrolase
VAATESEIAAKLIERLLADPAFRDRFRRDPPRACREAGLESLAEEMRLGAGNAMHTLDIRESRSSLAGVMMAAAMEGMGVYEFSQHVVPHLEDLSGEVGDVLSRIDLPALPGGGSLAGGPEQSAAALVPPVDDGDAAAAAGNGVAPAEAAPPAAPEAAALAAEPPSNGGAAKDVDAKRGGSSGAAPGDSGSEPDASSGLAESGEPRSRSDGARRADSDEPPVAPELAGLADADAAKPARREVEPPAAAAPQPAPAAAPEPAPAPVAQPATEPIDPSQFGQEGTGGKPSAEALALLENKNVVLDDVGVADIKAGKIDPRIVGVLTKLSKDHEIVVSCMCSDHSKFTSGGSISNHAYGRGLDIAAIDGEIVSPGSALAREVASELSGLDPAIRPSEIGSPFAISGPGYFTDAAHSNHIHVGFDTQIAPDWKPPAELAAGAPAAPAAPEVARLAPVAPAPDPKRASGLFAAAAPAELAGAEPGKPGGDSQLFLQAVKPAEPAAAPAAPADAAAPAAAAAEPAVAADADYPGDDAPKQQIAAWMASEAKKRDIPAQLPVMAALVESNLTNVNHGDADSLGYFQMRTSIWSQDYPGFPDDPAKQLDWFLDTAERVKEQRIARGQPIDDPSQYGEWIADVERPAEQYRHRYQERLDQANQLLQDTPKPTTTPSEPDAADDGDAPPAVARGAGPKALAALAEAEKYKGTPYKWGGSTPQTGFDCSGLVQWAYAQAGVQIPRVTHDQIEAANGSPVRRSELLPGDLVFFRDPSGYVYHVGISIGGDKFLHAPRTGDVVKVASLDEPYYGQRFTGGRRFDEAAPAAPAAGPAAAPAPEATPDPVAVAAAQAAVARDAAEVRRPDSGLFNAISAQEARNHREAGDRALASAAGERTDDSGIFFKAITREQAEQAKAAAEATPPAAPAPEVPAPPEAAPAPPEAAPGPAPDLSEVPADYPGDDAGQEALAKWLAKRAEKAGLPPELPVMAALVESGVRNLNYGDADSVGFFQMRTSIWNQGEYAGYPDNPGLQAKWFIDTALEVKRRRIAAGDAGFGKDPRGWGEWIADVERPAEQYRGRYQLRLAEARRFLR